METSGPRITSVKNEGTNITAEKILTHSYEKALVVPDGIT